jgi:hypothetical protein
MALILADRVKETTTTTGTGTVTLLGASAGYQSFSAVGNANTTYYTIAGQTTSEWEVGIGTYTSVGTTLSRTTVLSSSNGGSLVTFSSGTKDVFVTYPSSRSIYADGAVLTATNSSVLPVSGGGTGVTTSTGSGSTVLSTSPTLVTPALGTPSALVGTNITGTATAFTASNVTTNANLTGGVTSVGNAATVVTNANLTGDVTSVGNATTLTNAPVIAKVLTGYVSGAGTVAATDSILQAIQKLNGNNATNANLTGPITSTGNATAIAAQTGTGTTFVMQASPSLTTPALGTPSSGTLTNCTFPTLNQNTTGTAAGLSTTLAVASGGTGQTTYTNGQLLIGNTTGGTLTKTTLTAGSNITITNGAGSISIAGNAGTVTSVTGTSPVVSSGGATPAISMAAATTSVNGYLTSTDWTTFNGKLTSGGALGTPSSGTLTNCTFPTLNQSTTGSAATLTTGRTIAVTGDLTYTSPTFNGSANVTAAGTLATVNSNVGSFTAANITVNAKGLVTAAANGSVGKVLQVVQATTSTTTSTTSTSFADATGLTATITPSSATSRILVLCDISAYVQSDNAAAGGIRIVRGATAVYTDTVAFRVSVNANVAIGTHNAFNYLDSPSTTSATTYKIQIVRTISVGISYGFAVNVSASDISSITLLEIAA